MHNLQHNAEQHSNQLLAKYLDDRDSLSEEEFSSLVDLATANPAVAMELKQQLVLDELLAQKLAVDRQGFLAQVHQRIRDLQRGEQELERHIEDLRSLVTKEPIDRHARSRTLRWVSLAGTVAVAIAVAVGIHFWWPLSWPEMLAVVDNTHGNARLIRDGKMQPVSPAAEVLDGDRFETSSQQALAVRYPDGTLVQVDGASSVEFGNQDDVAGKRIFIHRGSLAATVSPQLTGLPLIIRTETAEAKVLGTQFWLSRQGDQTRLDVLEGRVSLVALAGGVPQVIGSGQFGAITSTGFKTGNLLWPKSREGLTFLFETQDRGNVVRESSTGKLQSCRLTPRGAAQLNHHFALELNGGSFVARGVADDLLETCRASGQMTLLCTLTPAELPAAPGGVLATFASEPGRVNLLVLQTGDQLSVQVRTRHQETDTLSQPLVIGKVTEDRPVQLALVYQAGQLTSYLDGKPASTTAAVQGDLSNWDGGHLVFGSLLTGAQPWLGALEGIAVYGRALSAEEISSQATAYQSVLAGRSGPAQIEVLAKLIALSKDPSADDMAPEEAALRVDHYQVDQVLSGEFKESEIYVARWAILDSLVQPTPVVGEVQRLRLEPFVENPQLADFVCRDDFLLPAPNAARYFLVATP